MCDSKVKSLIEEPSTTAEEPSAHGRVSFAAVSGPGLSPHNVRHTLISLDPVTPGMHPNRRQKALHQDTRKRSTSRQVSTAVLQQVSHTLDPTHIPTTRHSGLSRRFGTRE